MIRYLAHVILLSAAIVAGVAGGATAVEPDEKLADPKLEARARELSAELRCLVCQNQSIDDSDAPLAKDLRVLVRERLSAGDSDGEVMRFLVDRYGEFILLRPRLDAKTYALWIAPLLILLGGIALARRAMKSGDARSDGGLATPPGLTPEEQKRLREVLDGHAAPGPSSHG
jgi:cytochrome c-type biogenesis protein CcmH